MRDARPFLALFLLILLLTGSGGAQSSAPVDPALLGNLHWRSIGPANTGGRIDDFAVARVPGQPDTIYVATASGGVFKSTNQGTSWTPIFDRVDAMMSIGDIAVAPSNPNVVWVGTGEANNRQSSSWGDGVYKSADAGRTWKLSGLADTRHIGRIVIHPANPDVVYVAATGHLWGSNSERGVFKTTDGGQTFADVFSTIHSEDHALWIDPDDTNHLIVGGDGGVSISWDRGQTWLFRDNLPVGQFYEISADMRDPYVICGGLQDNGHWCMPSATRNRTGISNHDGFNIGSGDGFYARLDPTDARTAIIESQDGRANRVNLSTLERQAVSPVVRRPGTDIPGTSGGSLSPTAREHWNWNTPIVMSSFDPKTLYMDRTWSSSRLTAARRGRRSARTSRPTSTASRCR